MKRCLDLAIKGLGTTAPNPMVGAVIVYEDKIIGEGYTSPYGGPHAEVNAINSVADTSLLKESTLYVSLEPCSHFGKTPPCSNLIIEKKIPRVVVGTLDSFSKVNGTGIQQLKENGVDVVINMLEKECRELNKRFFTFHEKKRPYIILKWAQTKEGFIDRQRESDEKQINWITAPETKSLVHLWRSQESSILVGRKTIENDNPQLDVRLLQGKSPLRIILDPNGILKIDNWTHAQLGPTIIMTKEVSKKDGAVEWIAIENFNLQTILETCYHRNIQSIFVEGGQFTLNQFIQENTWDEARVLVGNIFWENGISAPEINQEPALVSNLGTDKLDFYRNRR